MPTASRPGRSWPEPWPGAIAARSGVGHRRARPEQGGSPIGSSSGGVSLVVARTALAEKPYVDAFPLPVARAARSRAGAVRDLSARSATARWARGTAWSSNGASPSRRRTTTTGCVPPPVGYFFDVITHGYGSMPDYAAQIPPRDRWAIVAYLRVAPVQPTRPGGRIARAGRKAALTELNDQHAQP